MSDDPLDLLIADDLGPTNRHEPCVCGGVIVSTPEDNVWRHRSGGCDNPAPADAGWWVL